jgi:DNA end-binding protein Ku
VDADTGGDHQGYKVDTDSYIEESTEELENIAPESVRTIQINEFVLKADIDPLPHPTTSSRPGCCPMA